MLNTWDIELMSTQQSVYKRTCTQRKLTFGGSINVWAGLQFDWIRFYQTRNYVVICMISILTSQTRKHLFSNTPLTKLVFIGVPTYACLIVLGSSVLAVPTYTGWLCLEECVCFTYLCCLIVLWSECSLVYLPIPVDCVTKWVFLGLPAYAGWLC